MLLTISLQQIHTGPRSGCDQACPLPRQTHGRAEHGRGEAQQPGLSLSGKGEGEEGEQGGERERGRVRRRKKKGRKSKRETNKDRNRKRWLKNIRFLWIHNYIHFFSVDLNKYIYFHALLGQRSAIDYQMRTTVKDLDVITLRSVTGHIIMMMQKASFQYLENMTADMQNILGLYQQTNEN